jgi:putative hydrolase of the HAD superfamily
MSAFDLIAFDADDTLWHNERLYAETQTRFTQLLSQYHPAEWVSARLYQTETNNLQHFGYGIKAFALSMIETAVDLTEGRILGSDIQKIIGWAREMLSAEVELLAQVGEVLPELAKKYPLMLITKGDLLDQETKLARSGLGGYFQYVEVVSQKTRASYEKLLKKQAVQPERFLMVGNSLRSDILPVLELGGSAVYVPYELTWLHEAAELPPPGTAGFTQLADLGGLPDWLAQRESSRYS